MRTYALLALAFLAPACGGGSGFEGDYQAVTYAETPLGGSCTDPLQPGTIPAGQEFFRLQDDNFFGASIVGWHDCTGPAQGCDDAINLFSSFANEEGEYRAGFLSWGGNPCNVSSQRGVLTRVDDTTIRITTTSRSGEVPELGDCGGLDSEDVEPFVDSLPCESISELTAQLVE